MRKLLVIPVLVVVLGIALCHCGYKLAGFGKQIPEHVKTIFIPDFDNKTTRYQIDQYVTYAVKEEFIQRSNLVLADRETQADALLEGTITRFDVTPLSFGDDASANLYKVTVEVNVLSFIDTYEIDSDDFFSQETETLIKIAREFAASVVTSILENF